MLEVAADAGVDGRIVEGLDGAGEDQRLTAALNRAATILESAARLLRERGISGARVADVMKGAGLTVGGFYAHFGSKEALVDEAFRWLVPGGSLVLELAPHQAAIMAARAREAGYLDVHVRADLTGRARVLVARAPDG